MLKLNRDLMKVKFEDLSTRESDNNHALKRVAHLTVPVEHTELGSTPYTLRVDAGVPLEADKLYDLATGVLREAVLNGDVELATARVWVDRAIERHETVSPETMAWVDALSARVLEIEKRKAEAEAAAKAALEVPTPTAS